MNFFGHAAVATWQSSAPPFVLGAMLPDLAAMIRARPPPVRHAEIALGVRYHHATDHAFHDAPTFRRLSTGAFVELEQQGVRRGGARAVAHVGIEILLDAELVRDATARRAYLGAVGELGGGALGTYLDWRDSTERARFELLGAALSSRGASGATTTPAIVAQRIEGALAGRPRLALASAEVGIVERWVGRAWPDVTAATDRLLAEVKEGLAGSPGLV